MWHTYRNKVEIFPGTGQPPGYAGSNASTFFGYDHAPTYIYANGEISPFASPSPGASPATPSPGASPASPSPGASPATASPSPSPATPWINLDEQSEIGLDTMYAGTLTNANLPFPGQQILFLAKANRAEYTYVAANGWWDSGTSWNAAKSRTKQYIAGFYSNPGAYAEPTPGSTSSPAPSPTPYVSFPNNTIEVKSAWRQLTAKEASSGRFYTTTVRFYNNNSSGVGYIDAVWGLVALHIIQKTPSAPYFIYATFSQADNILDASGNCIEDEEGNLRLDHAGRRQPQNRHRLHRSIPT